MASIHIDDKTAQKLQALASALGLTPESYIEALLTKQLPAKEPSISLDDFDAELESSTIDGPTLPANYSRADIYDDHD